MPIRPVSLLIVDNDDPVTRRVDAAAVARGYRVDYATSLAAVNTALESLAFQILDDHVRHCVAGALASGDEADARAKTEELLAAVHRFARTT